MIHSVADIHLEKGAGPIKAAARRFKPGTQTKTMRKAELPNTYVRAFWNDLCIYRTRMTPVSLHNLPSDVAFDDGADRIFRLLAVLQLYGPVPLHRKLSRARADPGGTATAPNFNGGSETFIRDWTLANITFAVMDYRDRGKQHNTVPGRVVLRLTFGPGGTDHDVLVGYVSLNLRDVFQEHSQVSK